MANNSQVPLKWPCIIVFKASLILLLILISRGSANADVFAEQLISTTTKSNCSSSLCQQNIGNGYFGDVETVQFVGSSGFSNAGYAYIWEWSNNVTPANYQTTAATSTSCGLQSGELNPDGVVQSYGAQGTYKSSNNPTWPSSTGTTTYNFSDVTLKPECYYWIGFKTTGGITLRGSSVSTSFRTSSEDHLSTSGNIRDMAFILNGTTTDTTTHIISFSPEDGDVIATTTPTFTPVTFTLSAYVNSADKTNVKGIRVTLHNLDQNDFLLGALSSFSGGDVTLVDEELDAGLYSTTTSYSLFTGNYRLKACLERSFFGSSNFLFSLLNNVVEDSPDCLSHQFVVGAPTFLGTLSQNSFDEFNDFVNGLSATSTEALASTCNPLNDNFGIRECMTYFFVPDALALDDTVKSLKDGVLIHAPFGYFTRVATILSNTSTTSLPSYTVSVRIGEDEYTDLTFDPTDMLAGASALIDETTDPLYNKSFKDVLYPIVQLIVAIGVLLTIISDVLGSHKHDTHNGRS